MRVKSDKNGKNVGFQGRTMVKSDKNGKNAKFRGRPKGELDKNGKIFEKRFGGLKKPFYICSVIGY